MPSESAAPADQVIDGAIVEVKPDNSLVVLNPEKYATELFASFNKELATAKRTAARTTYDITTAAGMETAKEYRTTFVKIRTRAEKAKSEAKRPIDLAGKKILEIYNTLEAAAKVEEGKHNKAIEDQEKIIAAEKQRKIDEERARVEAIENRVALIRNFSGTLAKADSVAIEQALADWSTKRLEPGDYQEQLEDALTALNETVDQLRALLTAAQEREAAARKAEEDARELARLKAEAAEREKREVEERQRREAEEKAKADEAAKATAAQAQLIANLQAQLAAAQKPAEPAPAPSLEGVYCGPKNSAPAGEVEVAANLVTEDQGAASIVTTEADLFAPAKQPAHYPTEADVVARPSDELMVVVLAEHFDVFPDTVRVWLRTFGQ